METIRNFSIIAHIDHGKSTLADRMLEVTKTVEKRKMREQLLDQMDLERERGITIKMQPVRMKFEDGGKTYTLNLIDTPGHIDFAYEVSRALRAVEGVVLLVDATQGVEAQTLSVLREAEALSLPIIPVVNKIDLPNARVEETRKEVARLLHIDERLILATSGKTGAGVPELLSEIIQRIPPPAHEGDRLKALIFDFEYSTHQGVILYVRLFGGSLSKKANLFLLGTSRPFTASDVGVFVPDKTPVESLSAGEIGYIVTGVKEASLSSVGDTVTDAKLRGEPVPGYEKPRPLVWASLYPENLDDFDLLKQALGRLSLSDSSFTFEEEGSLHLGRGFRLGFLGMLHLEIVVERLRREHRLSLVVTSPTIRYEIMYKNGTKEIVYSPVKFPEHADYEKILEPEIRATIITPPSYIARLVPLFYDHEAKEEHTETLSEERVRITLRMPLRELMRNFYDEVKSASSGYASVSYEMTGMKEADVARLDVLLAGELMPALSRVVSSQKAEQEANQIVEKLFRILPKEQFPVKIQAKVLGRIVASRTLPALRKDVTGYLYGGDVTRKKKLLEKQKKGKKELLSKGRVRLSHDVFLKIIR